MPAPKLPAVDGETLTPIVRTILKNEKAALTEWQSHQIVHGKGSSAPVYRIRGTAQVEDASLPWSLILKEIHTASNSEYAGNNATEDPMSHHYWKRELLVYQSGLFETLPAGFATPHCYQIDEFPNGSRLWMEEVQDDVGAVWPLEHYRHVARHFGRFHGQYLTGRPLPKWPWLFTNFLTMLVEGSEWPEFAVSYAEARQSMPLVQRA
jgi:hypothetical protein